MKRIWMVAVAAAVVGLAASGAWAQSHCCWEGNSYNDNKGYCGPVTPGGSATQEGSAAHCTANSGELVNGCSSCNVGTGEKNDGQKCDGFCKWGSACEAIATDPAGSYGTATTTCQEAIDNCDANGGGRYSSAGCTGDPIGGPAAESCNYYCKWPTGCVEIKTDPKGTYGDVVTSCAVAIDNCDTNGERYENSSCSGSMIGGEETCGGYYCQWASGCEAIKTDKKGSYGPVVATCTEAIDNCDRDGARFDNSSCSGTQIGGDESCGGYCRWESGCEAIKTDKGGAYGPVVATCTEALANCQRDGAMYSDAACQNAISVKYFAKSAKAPGLRVSYAKGKVGVTWTASSKISGGTVSLINQKGVTVSSGLIKASGQKVTASLGAGVVPAGMYIVRVNAKDVNGKKIVTQASISILK